MNQCLKIAGGVEGAALGAAGVGVPVPQTAPLGASLNAGQTSRIQMMRTPLIQLGGIIRRLAALALVLWLGGVGCLIGCEIEVSAATAAPAQAPSPATSCPAFSGPACCHKPQGESGQAAAQIAPQSAGAMSCCPLSGQSAAIANKPRVDSSALALTASSALPLSRIKILAVRPAGRLLVPDRGGTYLRCCVFLI